MFLTFCRRLRGGDEGGSSNDSGVDDRVFLSEGPTLLGVSSSAIVSTITPVSALLHNASKE
jgi:hypothetical protein